MSVQVKGSGTIGGLDEGLVVSGIVTSSTQINVGSNIKIGNAGVITATSFVGSGANLTSLPSQVTIANNADNRVITGGSGTNLNGEANLIFNGTELYPDGASYTDRDRVGHRLNYRRNPPNSRTNTGSASQRYYKIGQIVLNGSESAEINIYGTVGYSAGQEVAGKTTIIMRATNGGTLVGFWYEESLGQINLSDVRWKYTGSNNVYELWVQANNYSNIAPFVRCTGNGYTSFNEDTGSNTAPSGSTAFSTYNRKVVGTTATIRYNPTDTTFSRNIKMDSGYGIDFSATSDASGMSSELLDDYEEGSWTPTILGWDTFTHYSGSSYYAGWYVKVGGMVHCGWKIYYQNLSTPSSNAHIRISGLPYAAKTISAGPVCHVRFDIPDFSFSGYPVPYLSGNNTQIHFYKQVNGSNNITAINATGNYSNNWTMGTATYATN